MYIDVVVKKNLYSKTYHIISEKDIRKIHIELKIENDISKDSIDYLLLHVRKIIEHEMGHDKDGKLD